MNITECCWNVIFAAETLVDAVQQEEFSGEAWEMYWNLKDAVYDLNEEIRKGPRNERI